MTYLEGRFLAVWELGQPYAAENSIDDVCATAKQFGFQGMLIKALDGTAWHKDWSDNAASPGSCSGIVNQRAVVEAQGLKYGIWAVPQWGDRPFLTTQAGIYAAAGSAAGLIVLDAEPFSPDFWGANKPEGDAQHFMDQLRKFAPSLPIIFQPDGRPARLAELRPEEWLGNSNAYAPQIYWTDFGMDAEVTIALADVDKWKPAEFCPTFPGDATALDIQRAWIAARDLYGATGVILWRLGTAGPEQLTAVQNLVMEVAQSDPKDDEITSLKAQNEKYRASLTSIIKLAQDTLA